MSQFNINAIIYEYGLDIKALAVALFPNAKFPTRALKRILKGESELSVSQLENLAKFIGVSPAKLFYNGAYDIRMQKSQLTYRKDNYCIKIENLPNESAVQDITIINNSTTQKIVASLKDYSLQELANYLDNLTKLY